MIIGSENFSWLKYFSIFYSQFSDSKERSQERSKATIHGTVIYRPVIVSRTLFHIFSRFTGLGT